MLWKPLTSKTDSIYWYILQTNTAAEIAFNRYWDMIRPTPGLLMKKPNESEKSVQLIGNRMIFFKSGHEFENLRAETLDGCIIDEYRQQSKFLWQRVIRAMLARKNGWCDFLSTPNGFEHFYDLFEMAKSDKSGEWAAFHAPSSEAWWWTPEEISSAKATMSEAEFSQEIMAEFRDLAAGKAYLSFGTHNLSMTSPFSKTVGLWSPYMPIILGPDFNITPMAWTISQMNHLDWYFFDEIFLRQSHTLEASEVFAHKVLIMKEQGFKAEPNVIICGDATSKSSQRAAAGKSDYDILESTLKKYGITYQQRTPETNPKVKDRVNTMNMMMRAADGSVHFYLNPETCPNLKKDCERVVWKIGASGAFLDQVSNPDLTHISDGAGYAVCELTPLTGAGHSTKIRLIQRSF